MDNREIRAEIAELRARLDALERRLEPPPAAAAPPPPAPAPAAEAWSAAPPPPPVRRPELETRVGLTLVNRLGAITLILGVAFFFKYASENHWIGPAGRVLAGVAAGMAALLWASRLWRGGQRVYAQGISGAGIAILYIAFYAAYAVYRLIPVVPAYLLMVASTALAVFLSLSYSAEAIAALGLAGAYLTPLLLVEPRDAPAFYFAYAALLNAGAFTLVRRRDWPRLDALALAASAVLFVAWLKFPIPLPQQASGTAFVLISYALFAQARHRRVAQTAQVLAMFAAAALWGQELWPFLVLGLLLAAAGIRLELGLPAVLGYWPAFHVWYAAAAPASRPFAAVFLTATAAFALFLSRAPGGLAVGVNAAAYFGTGYFLLTGPHPGARGAFAFALALAHAVSARRFAGIRAATAAAAMAWLFLTLAVPIQVSGYRTTMFWAVEAAALVWVGTRLGERRLWLAAAPVYGLAVIRLLALDAWMYAAAGEYMALLNARFATFFLCAAALWAGGWWLRSQRIAAAPYISGHVALMAGIAMEVAGWAARTASPPDVRSVASTGISIALAVYAVALVGLGVSTRSVLNRALGLALIAFLIAKLYLYDVWMLGRIYRIAAFAALGALLLAMSYLYSRYRESIESWWREDGP